MRKITHILVHHTASPGPVTTVQSVNRFHRDKDWSTHPGKSAPIRAKESTLGWYVQYHYFIEWDGKVTQTRQDWEDGWHGNDANPFSIGICLAGWFDKGHDAAPTQQQQESLRTLLIQLMGKYSIDPSHIVPHRVYNPHKSCYGALLGDTWAADLTKKLTVPRIEKCGGKYASYDPDSDEMVPITDGAVLKHMFGSYKDTPAITVNKFSRPLSETKSIGLNLVTK